MAARLFRRRDCGLLANAALRRVANGSERRVHGGASLWCGADSVRNEVGDVSRLRVLLSEIQLMSISQALPPSLPSFFPQLPHAAITRSSSSLFLLHRLQRRFGESKEGLGLEPNSSNLSSARDALLSSIAPTSGHEQAHLSSEVHNVVVRSIQVVLFPDSFPRRAGKESG